MPKKKRLILLFSTILALFILVSFIYLFVRGTKFTSNLPAVKELRVLLEKAIGKKIYTSTNNLPENQSAFGGYLKSSETAVDADGDILDFDKARSQELLYEAFDKYQTDGVILAEKFKFDIFDEVSKIVKIDKENSSVDVLVLASKNPDSQRVTNKTLTFGCDLTTSVFLSKAGKAENSWDCLKINSGANGNGNRLIGCIETNSLVAYKCSDLGCLVGMKDCIFYE